MDFYILKFVKLLIKSLPKLSLAYLSPTVDRDRRPWLRVLLLVSVDRLRLLLQHSSDGGRSEMLGAEAGVAVDQLFRRSIILPRGLRLELGLVRVRFKVTV